MKEDISGNKQPKAAMVITAKYDAFRDILVNIKSIDRTLEFSYTFLSFFLPSFLPFPLSNFVSYSKKTKRTSFIQDCRASSVEAPGCFALIIPYIVSTPNFMFDERRFIYGYLQLAH
jgi:hypothetical protein